MRSELVMLVNKIFGLIVVCFTMSNNVSAVITSPIECSLNLSQSSQNQEIEERITAGNNLRLIRYHFNVVADTGPFSQAKSGDSYLIQPYSPILAIDGAAKALLHLKEYFIPMSLYTLNFSVAEFRVDLVQSPANCLENVIAEDLETELKLLIFRNFGASRSSAISLESEVCNQYVKVAGGSVGAATYKCCKLNTEEQFFCGDLERNVWTDILFAAIVIVQVVFVLYSPSLVPKRGRKGEKYINYTHKPKEPVNFDLVKINANDKLQRNDYVEARQFPFASLSSLEKTIRELKEWTLYTIAVREVEIFVKDKKVLAECGCPVRFFSFLKSFFILCKMGKELPDLNGCCNAKTCPDCCRKCECCCCCAKTVYKNCGAWYQILTFLMKVTVGIALTIPWLFRVWFYYNVEEDSLAPRKKILDRHGLTQPYPGSLVLSLTPIHPFFITIYAVIILIVVFIGFLPDKIKIDWYSTLRKSLENTRGENRCDIFVKFVAWMVIPMKKFGLFGIILFPLWLVPFLTFGLIVLGILIFPLMNFTFRVVLSILQTCSWKNSTRGSSTQCCEGNLCQGLCSRITCWAEKNISVHMFSTSLIWYAVALFLSLLEIVATLIIIVECVAFYAEWLIYVLIGIILNSDDILKYLVLIISVAFYAYRCFNSVGTRYQAFGKHINGEIRKRVGDDVMTVARQRKESQKERAFVVPRSNKDHSKGDENVIFTASSHSYLKWNAKRLLLFLDTDDIIFISRDFLMKAANMDHVYCPGRVHILYLDALIQLFWITLFLIFEIVVITAFGQANQISSLNQTMATLASGFLPFVFTKFLMKSDSDPSLDVNNIAWETKLTETIDNYQERWYLGDLITDKPPPFGREIASLNDIQNDTLIVKERHDRQFEFWVRKSDAAAYMSNSVVVHAQEEFPATGIRQKETKTDAAKDRRVSVHIPGSPIVNINA